MVYALGKAQEHSIKNNKDYSIYNIGLIHALGMASDEVLKYLPKLAVGNSSSQNTKPWSERQIIQMVFCTFKRYKHQRSIWHAMSMSLNIIALLLPQWSSTWKRNGKLECSIGIHNEEARDGGGVFPRIAGSQGI